MRILASAFKRNFRTSFSDLGRSLLFLIKSIAIIFSVTFPYNISIVRSDKTEGILFDSWVFYCFILADKFFEKALQSLTSCVSVNNNLCGKLVLH